MLYGNTNLLDYEYMKVVSVALSYYYGGNNLAMKTLKKPGNLTTLAKPVKRDSEKNIDKEPRKIDKNQKKDTSKNSTVKSETTNSATSNKNHDNNNTDENNEINVKEETTAMTVEYPERQMRYINIRIAEKLLSSGGKSSARTDFSKVVREIIDEAIERDKK